MGKRKRRKSHTPPSRPKTQQETQDYKKTINNLRNIHDSTVGIENESLQGSDEPVGDEVYNLQTYQKPTPPTLKKRITNIFRNRGFEIGLALAILILSSLIIPYFLGINSKINDIQITMATSLVKLDSLKEDVDKIASDNITREILEVQIEALYDEIQYGYTISNLELEYRIETIEKQLEIINNK